MNEEIKKEMMKIKNELSRKKEEIRDIDKLANKQIDRDLPSDVTGFSERELESQLEEPLSVLHKFVDPLPDRMSLTSHRKIIGKPIIWIKRILFKIAGAYFTHILEKQKIFNRKCADSCQAMRLQQKKHQSKIDSAEERISECEVHLEVVSRKLEELKEKLGQNQSSSPSGKPGKENK